MCKHCERIKEDLSSKPIIHAFFEDLASKCNRKAIERKLELIRPIIADDIDITVNIKTEVYKHNPLYNSEIVMRLMKTLSEMDK